MAQKRSYEDFAHQNKHWSKSSKKNHNDQSKRKTQQSTANTNPYRSRLPDLDARLPQKAAAGGHVKSYNKSNHALKLFSDSSTLPPLPQLSSALSNAPFTHASVANEKYGQEHTYDRLEFLGDAYLEVFATRLLYSRFTNIAIGKLSSLRERLVKNSTLAGFAWRYGFDSKIKMDQVQEKRFTTAGAANGNEQRKKGGQAHTPEKIMADVFEAYVAAVVLSNENQGFGIAEKWMTELWVETLLDAEHDSTLEKVENRKDELARMVGGMYVKIAYEPDLEAMGDERLEVQHVKVVAVYLSGWGYEKQKLGTGKGTNVKEAGMRAAADALDNNRIMVDEIAEIKRRADQERRERLAQERGEADLQQPQPQSQPQQTQEQAA